MYYFATRDIKKNYPLNLEPQNFAQSWFFKLCIRWFNIPLPHTFNLQTSLVQDEKLIEGILPYLRKAKKEIEFLPQTLHFLPNWLIFRPLNQWMSQFFRAQKSELERSLAAKIDEAMLKSPRLLKRDEEIDNRITPCIQRHREEIATHLPIKHSQTYQQITTAMINCSNGVDRLRKHREWVVKNESPKGEPIILQIGSQRRIIYGPPAPREQRDFEQVRLNRIDANIERENRNFSQINAKRAIFFLPAKYENPDEYIKLLEQRTQAALAPTQIYA